MEQNQTHKRTDRFRAASWRKGGRRIQGFLRKALKTSLYPGNRLVNAGEQVAQFHGFRSAFYGSAAPLIALERARLHDRSLPQQRQQLVIDTKQVADNPVQAIAGR